MRFEKFRFGGNLITRCRGGLFAGKVLSTEEAAPEGGRFDPKSNMGKMYRARYLKEGYLKALEVVKAAAVCSSTAFLDRRTETLDRTDMVFVLQRLPCVGVSTILY